MMIEAYISFIPILKVICISVASSLVLWAILSLYSDKIIQILDKYCDTEVKE